MRVVAWLFLPWFRISNLFSLFSKLDSESSEKPHLPDLYEAGIAEIQSGLEEGLFTSVDLVKVRNRPKKTPWDWHILLL